MIRTLIVDDEPLARRGIAVRLAREEGVQVVGECGDADAAVAAIERTRPTLVFLDVQMPGASGFEVIGRVGAERMPLVVFVTAHDAHAVRAFEVQALDYLLKPIDDERFRAALGRVRDRVAERREGTLGKKLAALLGEHGLPAAPESRTAPDRIAVRDRGRIVLVELNQIDWVQAEGDYISLEVAGKNYLIRETMAAMEVRLGPPRFVRIHRSTIVNTARLVELRPQLNHEYTVVLRGGRELKASRSYGERLREIIGTPL